MSELKTRKFFEAVPTSKEGFYQPGAFVDGYLKSDVDKVIAEKDKVVAKLKYKRCLAMAKWCEATAIQCLTTQTSLLVTCAKDRFDWLQRQFALYSRWCNRWLKIAGKLKEKI